jgi:hypothetical protein
LEHPASGADGMAESKSQRRTRTENSWFDALNVGRGSMLAEPCPCETNENLGNIEDFVKAAIRKAPAERSIDETLRQIKVKFKVEMKRWDAEHKKYRMQRDPKTGKLSLWLLHYDSEEISLEDLLTNGGRDLIHNASFMTGTQPAALTYYAICNPSTFSPSATDTTLNTEITTPSGLARHVCNGTVDGVTESFTHTAGGNTTVVVCGFKNNGSSAVTGIKGYGNFNAASAGTLGTESSFTSVDLQVNDVLKLTVTLTLG